jgi:ABC-type proline/glycine betaine transport system ATPase subunit
LFTEYPNEQGEIVKAAQDVTFTVPEGKLFTLLGPSGCGKTTTLRSIAGLEKPRLGEIAVNDRIVYSSAKGVFVTPNRRGFGMVFQSYAIWPHMNVMQNAAFPLEVGEKKFTRQQVRDKVMKVLTAVQLDHLADREATKLSGGQQQRLALARALVMEPALLLLDEPLSNLDAKLRHHLRFELKRLQRELKITTVYVTHDQSEALALSHEIAVMSEGRIQQIGSPRQVYERRGPGRRRRGEPLPRAHRDRRCHGARHRAASRPRQGAHLGAPRGRGTHRSAPAVVHQRVGRPRGPEGVPGRGARLPGEARRPHLAVAPASVAAHARGQPHLHPAGPREMRRPEGGLRRDGPRCRRNTTS